MNPGLCATCGHAEQVRGARSVFWLCGLSRADARFPRYPRLPVLTCSGYENLNAADHSETGSRLPAAPRPVDG